MKPILFNTEMVRAILEGRKTVTRRVVKPQPLGRIAYCMAGYRHGMWNYPGDTTYKYWGEEWRLPEELPKEERNRYWRPPCHTGDILYVRETWREYKGKYYYKANEFCDYDDYVTKKLPSAPKWYPSVHMPKEAARIFLMVTGARVERLQDMMFADLAKEGFASGPVCEHKKEITMLEFAELWDSTIKPSDRDRYGWAANPWVWVIEFERCEKPEKGFE